MKNRFTLYTCYITDRGTPTGTRGPGLPRDLKKTLGFLQQNCVIRNFAGCVLKLFAIWEDRGSLQQASVRLIFRTLLVTNYLYMKPVKRLMWRLTSEAW